MISRGSRLGPHEITAKLGEGGMGEVYRATDSRLKREVAIKVLPAAFTEDKERLESGLFPLLKASLSRCRSRRRSKRPTKRGSSIATSSPRT